MLHTFVGADREAVRETAREPMKDYLRSAAALIKQYAWAFPAFKKPAGVSNPMQLDLSTLADDEMEGVLEFAFRRYFEDSGLFGTVEDCVARVEALKRIGVDEIACLIDYGIPTAQVLDGLRPLAEVLARCNARTALADDDFSIAAQIVRHNVTHLQCTPSMARMLTMNDEARAALARVQQLMIGGEPLSGSLVADLESITPARIENMYGPTETTIWSSTGPATRGRGGRQHRHADRQHPALRARRGARAGAGGGPGRALHRGRRGRPRLLAASRAERRALPSGSLLGQRADVSDRRSRVPARRRAHRLPWAGRQPGRRSAATASSSARSRRRWRRSAASGRPWSSRARILRSTFASSDMLRSTVRSPSRTSSRRSAPPCPTSWCRRRS